MFLLPMAIHMVRPCTWPDGRASGNNSDLVAAIDQAVADGVDVINYSISGSQTNFRDPVEIAFLFAAEAGVFVAASAGNSGPAFGTVAHPSPWLTTVAAGTHNRTIVGGSVTLGNGATYTGVGYLLSAGPAPLIDAGAAEFLEEFRTPTTVVDASIRYGSRTGTDPEQVLEDAFGLQKERENILIEVFESFLFLLE